MLQLSVLVISYCKRMKLEGHEVKLKLLVRATKDPSFVCEMKKVCYR